ncbi:ABC transporter substrate-binding protein [Streptomyces sp. VRA16 Mangrove soil]|uniref:ABC transporter substrate-binding protein n=1 Tax=Streptomyces sp. VRA16 Mangrove soil TaxID=2817434 RepID=UPI001A9F0CF4|nr:ABC transporter substrate-binding protein [Streptomyces sp. VRA16 Mangrove soil]MBO1331803.1 peptide-binding protein [Streptomyces sp. VRA16 Mangrove soil]
MNRKTLVLSAAIGLLAPALAACGGSDGGSDGDAIVVGTTDQFEVTSDAPAPFDPAYSYDAAVWNVLRQTFQTLVSVPKGGGEPVPDAAQSCSFTDSGSERYACTLRKGLEFSDGRPMTAADVKYSIDRVLDIDSDSGISGLLSTVDTVEVVGKRQVVFHLNTSDATFPYKLATPAAAIVNPDHYAKKKLRDGFDIDGSGIYTLKTQVEHGKVVKAVFTKNPHYKGDAKAKSDKVELRSMASADAMETSLEKGDIDVMSRQLTPDQIAKFSAKAPDGINFIQSPGLETNFLGFALDNGEVRNKAVRQAIAQVVDRGQIASEAYKSTSESLYSLVPAGIAGHANSFFNKYSDPDKGKAAAILRDAGITTPVALSLHYTQDHYGPVMKKQFELLREQLNDSGLFKAEIHETKTWTKFRAEQLDGKYQVYGMGWVADFPDADNFLAPFLDKDNFLKSTYVNNTVRRDLIPASRREADRMTASKTLGRIQNIVADDVPVLPLTQSKQYIATRDDITGAEWALSATSELQLWELDRGVSG